jgi:DNA-binding XRE family transcriptional regulator
MAWSQRQLARAVGVTQQTLCAYEAGTSYPSLDTAAVLMAIVGVDRISDLWPDLDRDTIRQRLRMRAARAGATDGAS